jgi:hypothetical protein
VTPVFETHGVAPTASVLRPPRSVIAVNGVYYLQVGTFSSPQWDPQCGLSELEKGRWRARLLLGSNDLLEVNSGTAVVTSAVGLNSLEQAITANATFTAAAQGARQVTTSANANQAGKLMYAGRTQPLCASQFTSKYYLKARLKLSTTPDAQSKCGIGTVDASAQICLFLGQLGTAFNSGHATKFVLTKWASNAPLATARAVSTVNVDTNFHWFEFWVAGASAAGASVDAESDLSLAMTGMDTAGISHMPEYISNGTTAAAQTALLSTWQFLMVRE